MDASFNPCNVIFTYQKQTYNFFPVYKLKLGIDVDQNTLPPQILCTCCSLCLGLSSSIILMAASLFPFLIPYWFVREPFPTHPTEMNTLSLSVPSQASSPPPPALLPPGMLFCGLLSALPVEQKHHDSNRFVLFSSYCLRRLGTEWLLNK